MQHIIRISISNAVNWDSVLGATILIAKRFPELCVAAYIEPWPPTPIFTRSWNRFNGSLSRMKIGSSGTTLFTLRR